MNSPNDSFPINEPAQSARHPSGGAASASPNSGGYTSEPYQDNYISLAATPSAHRRARTLKARIKRNMLNDSFTSSVTSVASAPVEGGGGASTPPNNAGGNNGGRDPREESIFEAASALASMGIMSPNSSSMNAGGVSDRRHAAMLVAPLSDGSVPFSQGGMYHNGPRRLGIAPAAAAPRAATAAMMSNMTSNIAPPPSLSAMRTSGNQEPESQLLKERQQKEVNYLMAQQRRRHRDVLSTMVVRPPPNLGGSLKYSPSLGLGSVGGMQQSTNMQQPTNLVGSSGAAVVTGRMRSMSEHPQPSTSGRMRSLSSIPSDVNAATRLSNLAIPPPSSMQHHHLSQQHHEIGGISMPFPGSLIGSDIPLTFPQKLMEVLSNPEVAHIITWLPHGKGFIILQKRKFAIDVMPLYFKHSKFTSFTRKLNRWGFTRVSRGPEMGAYYHKYFQRNNHLLCMQMHCQSHNKPGSKKDDTASTSTNKDNDAENNTGKDGVGAPPSSPAENSLTSAMMPKTSPSIKSPAEDEDSHMEDHSMDHDSSPVPQVPSVIVGTTAPAPAASRSDNIPTVGGTTMGSSAFSTYAIFSEPRQKTEHGGTLAQLYSQHNHHPHRQHGYQPQEQQQQHQVQGGNVNSSSGYGHQAFNGQQQQQQIPRRGQGQQVNQGGQGQHDQKPWLQHQLVRDAAARRANQVPPSPQLQSFTMKQPSSASIQQPIPTTLRSCMKQSPQPHPSQQQQQQHLSQQRREGGASPMQISSVQQIPPQQSNHNQQQNLLGVNTTSSRNHPHIIANALDSLKSCNEEAYLTAMMNKEHDAKAKSLQPQSNSSSSTATTPLNTYQVQSRVHAAMEAQLRQLEGYNRERQNSMAAENISMNNSSSLQDSTSDVPHRHSHALMTEKMKQMNKINSQQQHLGMGGNAGGLSTVGGLKGTMQPVTKANNLKDAIPQSTYGTVARLYNEINAMNQQQQGGVAGNQNSQSGMSSQQGPQRKFFRAVRRASAA